MNQQLDRLLGILVILIIIIVVGWFVVNALADWAMEPVTNPNWTPDVLGSIRL